jgi:hypothetical protein
VTVFAGDEKLTTALLDRLAHHATVLTTKGKSYRMRKRGRLPSDSVDWSWRSAAARFEPARLPRASRGKKAYPSPSAE